MFPCKTIFEVAIVAGDGRCYLATTDGDLPCLPPLGLNLYGLTDDPTVPLRFVDGGMRVRPSPSVRIEFAGIKLPGDQAAVEAAMGERWALVDQEDGA